VVKSLRCASWDLSLPDKTQQGIPPVPDHHLEEPVNSPLCNAEAPLPHNIEAEQAPLRDYQSDDHYPGAAHARGAQTFAVTPAPAGTPINQ
jgi:hypothetical protein